MDVRESYTHLFTQLLAALIPTAVIEVKFGGFKSIGKWHKPDVICRLVYSVDAMFDFSWLTDVQLSGGSLCL